MNIDDHVNQIVQNIVAEITTKVQAQAAAAIDQKINDILGSLDYTPLVAEKLSQKLDARLTQIPIDSVSIQTELTSRLDNLAQRLSTAVETQSMAIVNETVSKYVNKINFQDIYETTLISAIQNRQVSFPESSIPHTSIDLTGFVITGDNVKGGIIQKFGSTGIDDQSTACQVTIMDSVTVVENNLLTRDLTVKGTTTIEGDLNVTGTLPESSPLFQSVVAAASNNVRTSLDQVVFQSYADMVLGDIKTNGLDLNKITVNGQEVVSGTSLGPFITGSNLQKVGELQELQVTGESFLGGTLYTSTKRVGVNTIEPAQALSVWDQEVEIGIGKQTSNTGIIGTPRPHTLIVSTNGKNNLTLTPDGAVAVSQLNLGSVTLTSSTMPPSSNMPIGSIVFNASPSIGGPLGWVSLGDGRWANFGFID
jgi:hypothetical protein